MFPFCLIKCKIQNFVCTFHQNLLFYIIRVSGHLLSTGEGKREEEINTICTNTVSLVIRHHFRMGKVEKLQ